MENTAICWDFSNKSETISRQEHLADKTRDNSPQRLIRSGHRFTTDTLFDYYLLGYTTADGCILRYPERNTYRIIWSSTDREILERIKIRFCGYGNILLQKKYKDKHSQVYVYAISGKELVADFMSYGILPRKTYNPQFPSDMTKDQLMSFVAGLIDGDGCWWWSKSRKTPALIQSIRSYSYVFLEEVMNALKNELNIIGSIHTDASSPRLLYATRAALLLYEALPKEFCCSRKLKVVEEFVAYRGGWDNIKRICKGCGTRFIKYRHNQMYCPECYKVDR